MAVNKDNLLGRTRGVATSIDVARLAGVSRSAVSRTFTDGASVAPDTRARVLAAAETLKYRPNQIARSLITKRSMIVGLAISHLDNQFYPSVVEEICARLSDAGYRALMFITRGEESLEPLLGELLRFGVDGLLLASGGALSNLVRECAAVGLPVVMFNNAAPDASVPHVVGDNRQGGAMIARFLLAGGHARYAFLSGTPGVSTSEQRHAAYRDVLVEAGHARPVRVLTDFSYDDARARTVALLSGPQAPDALFCANDHLAFAALHAAVDSGKTPGRDVSIVGFDDVEIARWPALSLTTYRQSPSEIAGAAIATLQVLLRQERLPSVETTITGRLVVRNSTRRPAEGLVATADGDWAWRPPSD